MRKDTIAAVAERGFTLTELAVVLVIVGLLIGGMLVPLSTQRDLRNVAETKRLMAEITEALYGFAIVNQRLPCPSTTADPADANYGVEDSSCSSAEGYLPWKSLGVAETDAWGIRRSTAADPFTGYWRYRVDSAFAKTFTLATATSSGLSVKDAAGNALTQSSNGPVAIVYSTGPDHLANGQNASSDATYQAGERTSGFDDILLWIGRPVLINRMVAAGKLP